MKKVYKLIVILIFLLPLVITFSQQQNVATIEDLKKALQEDPNNPQLHNQLGLLYLQNNQIDSSISEFETAFSLDPQEVDYINNLGIAYYLSNKLEDAKVLFQKGLQLNPSMVNIHLNLGIVYKRQAEYGAAISEFDRVIELDNSQLTAYENLGEIYGELKDWEKAIKYFEKANEIKPQQPAVMNNLAFTYFKFGDKQKALSIMEQVSQLEPTNETVKKNLNIIKDSITKEPDKPEKEEEKKAEVIKESAPEEKKFEQTTPSMEKPPTEIVSDKVESKTEEVKTKEEEKIPEQEKIKKGEKEYKLTSPTDIQKKKKVTKKDKGAIKKEKKVKEQEKEIKKQKEVAKIIETKKYTLIPISEIYRPTILSSEEKEKIRAEKIEKERKILEETQKREEKRNYDKAIEHLQNGNFLDAYTSISGAIELNPGSSDYYVTLGIIEFLTNNNEYARKYFDKALDIDKNNYQAIYGEALIDYKINEYNASKEKLTFLISQNILFAPIYGLYGTIKLKENEIDEGENFLKSAIDRGINDGGIYNNLALIYLLEGNSDIAINLMNKALKLKPNDETIQNNYYFITTKDGNKNALRNEISKIGKEKGENIFEIHKSESAINLLTIEPIKFYEYIADRWEKKKIVILPFTQPAGYERWEVTPGENLAYDLSQIFSEAGFFDVEFVNDKGLTELFNRNVTEFINRFVQDYDADIVITGKFLRFDDKINVRKKMYGFKKQTKTIMWIDSEVGILDVEGKKKIFSDILTGEIEVRKNRPIDIPITMKLKLEKDAIREFCSNVTNFLSNYFNLINYEKSFSVRMPRVEKKEKIRKEEEKYYRLRK